MIRAVLHGRCLPRKPRARLLQCLCERVVPSAAPHMLVAWSASCHMPQLACLQAPAAAFAPCMAHHMMHGYAHSSPAVPAAAHPRWPTRTRACALYDVLANTYRCRHSSPAMPAQPSGRATVAVGCGCRAPWAHPQPTAQACSYPSAALSI